ncbi:MAG: (Fe-S)-binding protein [Desulfobacteraceae bacterium 4572_130]|nr:MAG: (Fe-S)-binding protein [Desulfobacteraceae bacterium 4572_130]
MSAIKELAKQMQKLEAQLITCMKCGMCQSVCPLFKQTHKEADVARGKIALLESLMKEMFDNPHGVNKRLNKCLLCGSCEANCPSGVNSLEIFIRARTIITKYLKLSFIKKQILRNVLARPYIFNKLINIGTKFQKYILVDKHPNTQTASLKLLSPLLNNRRIVPFANLPFEKSIDKLITNTNTTGPRVAFFTGCLIDKIYPRVGIATVKTLLHHNLRVFIPKNQGCCGIPALAAGDMDTFLSLVKYNLKIFDPGNVEYIVTSCATCTATLKKLWTSMTQSQNQNLRSQIMAFAEKVYDINEFLTNIVGLKKQKNQSIKSKKNVTYHDPCHLAKSLGIKKEPRQIINAAIEYNLKEMTDADLCCGMGGSFNLYHYDISLKIGNIKKKNIQDTSCHTVATSCPACMMQISDMLSQEKSNIYVKHPIELYAQGIE